MSADLIMDAEVQLKGTQQLKAFSDALSTVNDTLRELVSTAKSVEKAFTSVEKASAGVRSTTKATAAEVKSLTQAYGEQAAARSAALKVTDNRSSGAIFAEQLADQRAAITAEKELAAAKKATAEVAIQTAKSVTASQKAGAGEFKFTDNRASTNATAAYNANLKAASAAQKHGEAVVRVAAAYKDAADYAKKMQDFIAKGHGNVNPDAGTKQYHNIATSLDTFRSSQSDESSRKNAEIAKSMQARANMEIAASKQIEEATGRRVKDYTEEEQALRRNAVAPKASNNKISSVSGGVIKDTKDAELKAMGDYYRNIEAAQNKAAAASANLKKNVKSTSSGFGAYNDKLANTRYALYDVSNTMAIGGAALLAFNGIVVKAAMDYETAMAQISRTSGVSGNALDDLQGQFVGLAQTIPVAFSDLAKIGTLGGQLNVPADRLASFTKTVAEFSATTNVTAEASATAFGRLDALLPDVQGNYEKLGSSILNVGVNSVATEQEIITTSSQIAAAGAQAGMTADQVIGLSASFASLGVPAEASRGTVVRVFGLMNKAIAEGGGALDAYAKVAGVSSKEFKQSWGTSEFSGTFLKFLKGVSNEGSGAQLTLANLGITAARDQNSILKLGQNYGLVADNLGYAKKGFQDGTQLQSAFAIQAATLASKIKVLVGTFQALFATAGGSALAPLGFLVDTLKNLGIMLTEIAKNPVVAWTGTVFGAFTALSGVMLLVGSGFGRLIASLIAFQPVKALVVSSLAAVSKELTIVNRAANVSGVSLNRMQTAGIAASRAFVGLRGALASTGVALVGMVAIGATIALFDAIGESMKSNGQKAKDAFGDMSDLSTALKDDTAAAKDGAVVYGTVKGSLSTVTDATTKWTGTVKDASTGQLDLTKSVTDASTATDNATFSIGKNTAAWLANKLASDESVQGYLTAAAEFNKGNGRMAGPKVKFDQGKYLSLAAKNDTEGAKKYLADYQAYADKLGIAYSVTFEQVAIKAEEAAGKTGGALQVAANAAVTTTAVQNALGVSGQGVATAFDLEGDAASNAADHMKQLQDAIAGAFSVDNAVAGFSKDFYDLSSAIATGGTSFDAFNSTGQANLANLQTTIASSIASGESLGMNASESVAIVFEQLKKQGVDVAHLLGSLSQMAIPGLDVGDVKAYVDGSKQYSDAGSEVATQMARISAEAHKAAAATQKTGEAAAVAAPKIRTLVDYANDLQSVFSRAFELRFGTQTALDKIATGWQDIRDQSTGAAKAIKDARAEIAQLTADRNVQEYFLGIAKQYGDTLRAGEISAGIATIDSKIADQKKIVTDNTDKNSKALTGNSKAAIDNRGNIQGLVGDYEDLVTQYASSGMSQDDLKKKVKELKAEFIAQATQLGYNKEDVKKYAGAFDDVTTTIGKIPRNVTVKTKLTVNDYATQAIAEFMAKQSNGKGASKGVVVPVTTKFDGGAYLKLIQAQDIATQIGILQNQLTQAYKTSGENGNAHTTSLQSRIAGLTAKLKGLKTGGYTGDVGTSTAAGIVHGKEYVLNAKSTARLGIPFLNALNNGAMPTSTQAAAAGGKGSSTMVVELSSYDRMLLKRAGDVSLSIGNKVVAQATNKANLVSAKRGSS